MFTFTDIMPLKKLYIEIWTPSVVVLVCVAFGTWLGYEGRALLNGIAFAKSLQLCPSLCDPIDGSPPGSPIPGILQARTRVGCHFLLRCMKVKSEREVTQSCPTLRDTTDCSPPGSSVHGISTLVKGTPGSFLPLFIPCEDSIYCWSHQVYGIFVLAAQID